MKLTLQLLALFLTTCGVAHDEPVAAVAWDDVSEAGWTLAETGFVELPARHITHALSAGEKLVTVVDATGAAFMAQVRKGGGATPLIPMDERMSAGGRWAHLTLRRAPRPPLFRRRACAGSHFPLKPVLGCARSKPPPQTFGASEY